MGKGKIFLSKYSASGNDFILTYHFYQSDWSQFAKSICNRWNGIGADGFIVILPCSPVSEVEEREGYKWDKKGNFPKLSDQSEGKKFKSNCHFRWQFYNSDGSIAEMCGNGSRATAHFAFQMGLAPAQMVFSTLAGKIGATVKGDWVKTQLTPHRLVKEQFEEFGFRWKIYNTGVPHLVTIVENVEQFDLKIAQKMRWKYNANVNFGSIEGKILKVRTFERGVEGETLACGTGICATFLTARDLGMVGERVVAIPKSGEKLEVSIENGILHFAGRVKPLFSLQWEVEWGKEII